MDCFIEYKGSKKEPNKTFAVSLSNIPRVGEYIRVDSWSYGVVTQVTYIMETTDSGDGAYCELIVNR